MLSWRRKPIIFTRQYEWIRRVVHVFGLYIALRFTWCMQSLREVLKSRTLLWSSRNGNCWISLVWYSFQTVLGAFKVLSALARNLDLSGRQLDQTNSLLTCFVHIAVSLYFFYHVIFFSRTCVFVCGFFVPRENFSLIWRRHHCRWWATNFDLSSALMGFEGSLTCHTYCDTNQSFIMVISEDPWHSHLLPSV